MAKTIWPVSDMYFPVTTSLVVDAFVNNFGDGFEQRIVTSLPRGPRSDGDGDQATFVGRHHFLINVNNLQFATQPVSGNTNLDNSIKKLWQFFKDRFYNATTKVVRWESFYFYNPDENDAELTWTGDTTSSGTNSRNEAVTNAMGRYIVRFSEPNMSRERFIRHLFTLGLELIEVDD